MQVGSLIFVVIVATWAVYLLQHWIRRREDAAASDSVERFSEAMRVLEKRTHAAAVATTGSPFMARRATPTARRTPAEVAPMSSSHTADPTRPAGREDTRRRAAAPDVPAAAPRSVPAVSRWRRQVRGVVLLLALLWVPASVVLAVLHVLLWISVPLAVLTLVAVLAWLRLEVRADRAKADRGHAEGGRAEGGRAERGPAERAGAESPRGTRSGDGRSDYPNTPQRARRTGRDLTSDDTQVIHAPQSESGDEAGAATSHETETLDEPASAASGAPSLERVGAGRQVRRGTSSAAYDFQAELEREAAPAPVPQPAEEGTWSPVPVPRPTYTMKAKAEPRMTAAGVPADVFATPEFAEEAEELDERGLFARRAANL